MHVLLHSEPPTLQQATTDPRLRWRLLDNHRKTPLPFTDLNHSYQGQEQHIKSTSFQGTDDWNTPRKSWLSKVGSPSSRIDRTNFSNEKTISKLEYSSFNIRY
ncbi:acylphosphatase-2 isoform X10 [Bubalus kerabau]|uniref:acylphosphatase-2 isoform X10 n=1 Tax=Bubalus carabanensis TaxID=3119969 RepID=UPI00244E9F34|nr:acylphosphatase-2 isoform X10 [Bubalus carabanensis]